MVFNSIKRLFKKANKEDKLEHILSRLNKKGLFEVTVLSDQNGLIVSEYSPGKFEPRSIGALSSKIYSVIKRAAKDLTMGEVNYIILNSKHGEIISVPVKILNYSKEFILTIIVSNQTMKKISTQKASLYEETIAIVNQYSYGSIHVIKKYSSSYPNKSTIDKLLYTSEDIKEVFS